MRGRDERAFPCERKEAAMQTRNTGIAGAMFLLLILLAFAAPAAAQDAPQALTPQAAQQEQEAAKPQSLVDTSGKVRLSLHGALGFGFDQVDVGVTTNGDTVSISGGGGFGGGAGIGYGLSRNLDLDLDLGFEAGVLTPAVDNAEGSFTRGYFLATLKYKMPTSDSGQFKFGVGIGEYFGGKMTFKRTDIPFQEDVEYDPAIGLHLTGEFERFITPNVSVNIGGKIYFVEYEAKSFKFNSGEVPLSALKDEVRNLNGSGIDLLIGINVYFN
jgi:hypothetical protein